MAPRQAILCDTCKLWRYEEIAMMILFLIVFGTVAVLFLCALLEATLYTTRLGTLEAALAKGEQVSLANRLAEMKLNIGAPIASILILNTVANTAGATLAGAVASDVLGPGMLTIFSLILTLVVLFFGEIMPKTLAAVYWRQLWPYIVWPLVGLRYSLLSAGSNHPQVLQPFYTGPHHADNYGR